MEGNIRFTKNSVYINGKRKPCFYIPQPGGFYIRFTGKRLSVTLDTHTLGYNNIVMKSGDLAFIGNTNPLMDECFEAYNQQYKKCNKKEKQIPTIPWM